MNSLARDAWRKVLDRQTTIEEVRPILGLLARDAAGCPTCGAPARPGFRACTSCGGRLKSSCKCGATTETGWRFCPECAGRLNQAGITARPNDRAIPAPENLHPLEA
jgi:hypothetical protein